MSTAPLPHGYGTPGFWPALDRLVAESHVVIDRPSGSRHPRNPEIVYPLDYGYLAGTSGGDGDGVDVWRGSRQAAELDAVVCTVDLKKRDVEIKLLVGCTEEEKHDVWSFHSGTHNGIMLLRRGEDQSGQ